MTASGDADGLENHPTSGGSVLDQFTPFPYHSLNARGEIQAVNEAWLDCLGYERDEIIGKPFVDLLPAQSKREFESVFETNKTEGTVEGSFHVQHADGHLLRIEYRGTAETENGNFERCHGQFLDSREVYERKVQLEKAQDVADIGRWSKDIPSDQIHWSDRVYDIWGMTDGSGPIDHRTFIEHVHPEDRERVEKAWAAAKNGEEYDIEHRIITDEGEVKWMRERAELEFDEGGDPISAMGIVQDITERKNREQTYRERGEKYETLVESSQDGIIVIQEGQLVMVNERFASMFGYDDAAAVEGTPYLELVAPEYQNLVEDRYRQRVAGGDPPGRYEIEALTADGERIDIELSASQITYDGYPADMALVRDISERKRRVKNLHRFKNAVEAAGQGVIIADADGQIEYVNPAFEEITGYTKAEAVGQTPRILKSGEMSDEFYEDMWETVLNGETWQAEFTNRRKNGELYHVNQTVSPIMDDEGTIEAFAAVQTDITDRIERVEELRIQTERLDMALEGANLSVWDWDMQADEVYRDDRWATMLGYDPDEIGTDWKDWESLLFPGDRPAYQEALARHIEETADYIESEYRLQTAAGDWKWIRNRGKIVDRDEDGTPLRAVGIHQDIDEQKRTKNALEKNNELLRAIDRVLRHNINNDMNVIKGFAETIAAAVEDPLESQAQQIVESSEKLLQTTDKERRITKLLTEGEGLQTVNIGALIERVVERHRQQYPSATIETRIPEPVTVTAVTQLDQAIAELLENATIHTVDPEPTIEVTMEPTEQGATISVTDDGPGIPEMERQVLTGEGDITPLYHGSGLGLWFVNLVVSRSEGHLQFGESADGGSIVTLRLPGP